MNQPNLFKLATSELSQDAFICWLLSWANPDYKETNPSLHLCGVEFVNALFSRHQNSQDKKKPPATIESIKIYKQADRIDVLCVVNDQYALLIEDKTTTSDHSNQLNVYLRKLIKDGYKDNIYKEDQIYPIYLKTHDQSNYKSPIDNKYALFLRNDFINVLNYGHKLGILNEIFLDFRNHLIDISNQVNSYQSKKINEWSNRAWIGFYIRLQKELETGSWKYVPNKAGGFYAFFWSFQNGDGCRQYIQIESNRERSILCFKIDVNEQKDRKKLRNTWSKAITTASKSTTVKLKKPQRFGIGQVMTVAVFSEDYQVKNTSDLIDIEATVKKLKAASSLLKTVSL